MTEHSAAERHRISIATHNVDLVVQIPVAVTQDLASALDDRFYRGEHIEKALCCDFQLLFR